MYEPDPSQTPGEGIADNEVAGPNKQDKNMG